MEHNVFQYSCAVLMKIYSIYKTLIEFIRFSNVTCKTKLTKLNWNTLWKFKFRCFSRENRAYEVFNVFHNPW